MPKSVMKHLDMWAKIAANVKYGAARRFWAPPPMSMKVKYSFDKFFGFQQAASVDCSFTEQLEVHQRYRRFSVRIRALREDGISVYIGHDCKLLNALDQWCTESFGRGYKKPGSRWSRGLAHGHLQEGKTTYFFRNRADAAAFKFYWHNAELTENATKLNGIPF